MCKILPLLFVVIGIPHIRAFELDSKVSLKGRLEGNRGPREPARVPAPEVAIRGAKNGCPSARLQPSARGAQSLFESTSRRSQRLKARGHGTGCGTAGKPCPDTNRAFLFSGVFGSGKPNYLV